VNIDPQSIYYERDTYNTVVARANTDRETRNVDSMPDGLFAVATTMDGNLIIVNINQENPGFGQVVARVNTDKESRDVDCPDGNLIYVTNFDTDDVSVYEFTYTPGSSGTIIPDQDNVVGVSLELIDTIPVGENPEGIVIDPKNQQILVTSSDEVTIINIQGSDVNMAEVFLDLKNNIQNMIDDGTLKQWQAHPLLKRLQRAKIRYDKGYIKAAIYQLRVLKIWIKAYIKLDLLSSEQGQELIDGLNYIIEELVSMPGKPVQRIIGNLKNEINNLVSSEVLNQRQARSLKAKLNSTLLELERDEIKEAINQLKIFINRIRILVRLDVLTPAEGYRFIEEAKDIIALIVTNFEKTIKEALLEIVEDIESLKSTKLLSNHQGNALIKKINDAFNFLKQGKMQRAKNKFNQFKNQVNNFIENDILSQQEGVALIDAVEDVVALINSSLTKSVSFDESSDKSIPRKYALHQNYPNPFNPNTTISYDIPDFIKENVHVKLGIYNLLGQLVITLIDEEKSAGRYTVIWNGKDENGIKVSSGIYLFKIKSGDFQAVKKMILMQ